MNSMQKAYLKSLNAKFVIKVISLDGKPAPNHIINSIAKTLPNKYKIFFDEEEGIIYTGKRI